MTFGNWKPEIHDDPDQKKRLVSAKKADITPSSVNHEEQTAEFEGSGKTPYHTTLDSCTCVDFVRRKKPCKHIYRLALELGLIDGDFKTGVNKNVFQKDINDIMKCIYEMEPEDQETFFNCLYKLTFRKQSSFHLMPESHPTIFIEKSLMIPSKRKNTYTFPDTIQYHKNRIYKRMHSKFIYTQKLDESSGIVFENYQEVFDHNMDAYSLGEKPPSRNFIHTSTVPIGEMAKDILEKS